MSKEKMLNTDILGVRIVELEYSKIEKISAEQIRRIYINKISKGDFVLNRLIRYGLIITIFIIGGCSTSVEEGEKMQTTNKLQPETRAFQDDFTREFMYSTKEVKAGYYRFKSKTEGYTMLFPKNAKVDAVSYGIDHDVYETYIFGEQVKGDNLSYEYQVTYENKPITNNIEVNLDLLSTYVGYEGKYEKFEYEGKTYYYAKDVFATKVRDYYSFFSYIKSNKSDKAISYSASSTCLNQEKSCGANTKEIEERFKMLMKSVDF